MGPLLQQRKHDNQGGLQENVPSTKKYSLFSLRYISSNYISLYFRATARTSSHDFVTVDVLVEPKQPQSSRHAFCLENLPLVIANHLFTGNTDKAQGKGRTGRPKSRGRGILPYSLGGGVPLGSRKS